MRDMISRPEYEAGGANAPGNEGPIAAEGDFVNLRGDRRFVAEVQPIA
jgi:hypothetical protein